MSLKIDLSRFEKNLKRYVVRNDFPKLLRKATELALPQIRQEFKRIYRKTDFSEGLRGQYPFDYERDVGAILGFYPTDVTEIDDRIGNILGEAISISPFITRNLAVYFQINSQNLKDFLASEYGDGSYETESGATVDWLNWMLYGGQVNATLVLKAFDESRSGRGLMMHIGKGQWDASDYDVFPASADGGFIADLLNDKEFTEKVEFIIADKFRKVVGG